jgi:protein-L-isoaspartate(D-aspartate) O-methyltransferase
MTSHDSARTERLRIFFASFVAAGLSAPRVAAAFATVPRERFAGPGPWWVLTAEGYVQTPDDDPAFLYQDTLIALDRERGVNIGQPSLHALCLATLAIESGDEVIQVGAGSGYYTALLAELAGPSGRVSGYELDPDLAARAATNLSDRPTVRVFPRSGTSGEFEDASAIYVNAGATRPVSFWLAALKPGGRLLFPLTPEIGAGVGAMLLVSREPGGKRIFPARFICPAQFIACEGARDPTTAARLARAFATGGWRAVCSLRLGTLPDGSCWFAGDDWWLSTAKI